MEFNDIISLIGNFGFPIFCCVMLAYYVKVQTDQYRKDVKDIQREHKEEIAKVTDALNNNTSALNMLVQKFDNLTNG